MQTMPNDVTNKEILIELRENTKLINEIREAVGGQAKIISAHSEDIEALKNTTKDILEAVHAFAEASDSRFDRLESKMTTFEFKMTAIESQMVTKDYLDEKLWGLQGDMVGTVRREIKKHEQRFHSA